MAGDLRLGAVGTGHWFDRLYAGIITSGRIRVAAVAGARSFQQKADKLSPLGITERSYYQIAGSESLPEAFFDSVDIVHISTPNTYHESQTLQAIDHSKVVITEKTFSTNPEGFERVLRGLRANAREGKAYLHLHYTHKTLTTELPRLLARIEPEHGRITSFSATFFEDVSKAENSKRLWIFQKEHGGIFMDWIHPFEVLFYGANASSFTLKSAKNFIVNKDYNQEWPTGILAEVLAQGSHFAPGALGSVSIGMGVPAGKYTKRMTFAMESGAFLRLDFVGAETEMASNNRGSWELYVKNGGSKKTLASGAPTGPSTSDIFAEHILRMCDGTAEPLNPDALRALFAPQWEYQKQFADTPSTSTADEVSGFVNSAADHG